jgi:uncharacterized protein YbaR (Trm112 family)
MESTKCVSIGVITLLRETMTLLMCPECSKSDLSLEVSEIKENEIWTAIILCSSCKRWYPVINGIPHLLPDNLRKKDSSHRAFFIANKEKFGSIRLKEYPPLYECTKGLS